MNNGKVFNKQDLANSNQTCIDKFLEIALSQAAQSKSELLILFCCSTNTDVRVICFYFTKHLEQSWCDTVLSLKSFLRETIYCSYETTKTCTEMNSGGLRSQTKITSTS